MKVGLLISTFDRPKYLKQCFDSLKKADISNDVLVMIFDDASTNEETLNLITNFKLDGVEIIKLKNNTNSSISYSLKYGYNELYSKGCEIVINLDSDAIVKPNFIRELVNLVELNPQSIVTGFNSLVKNGLGRERHPIVKEFENCYYKRSCGGINMAMKQKTFKQYVESALNKVLVRKIGNWDTIACRNYSMSGKNIIVTRPSVVQHIGFESSMGHDEKSCVAFDFDEQTENKKKKIILNQFAGIGDVLFCIEIARKYVRLGHEVIWPVEKHYVNIAKHFPDINFVSKESLNIDYANRNQIETNDSIIIPLRFSDSIMKVKYHDCMKSKYMMFDMDWNLWRGLENSFVRFSDSENKLFELLGINQNEEYCVVNMQFRNGGRGSRHIPLNHGMKTVEMHMIPGFTLLDWAKVLEFATEIHTVSTSIIYLLEMIESKARMIKIYIRRPDEKNHDNYKYILTNINNYVFE